MNNEALKVFAEQAYESANGIGGAVVTYLRSGRYLDALRSMYEDSRELADWLENIPGVTAGSKGGTL